ncbi:MAG: caspase family protein [Pseudomonadota bacterium]
MLRRCYRIVAAFVLTTLLGVSAHAQAAPPAEPILRLATEQHTATVHAVAASADGAIIATAGDDKTIRLWRASDGAALDTIRIPIGPGEEGLLYALAFAPSGKFLLAGGISGRSWGGRNYIYIIRPESGQIAARLPVSGAVSRITYGSYQGEARIAIALSASSGGGIQIRDAKLKTVFQDIELSGNPKWVEFTPDGDLVAVMSGGEMVVYDAETFAKRSRSLLGDAPAVVRPSPDGTMAAVGYFDRRAVDVIKLSDLQVLSSLSGGFAGGEPHLNAATWRTDDTGASELWAGGAFADQTGRALIRRWKDVTAPQKYDDVTVVDDVITVLETTPEGEIIYAASDPAWGVIKPDMKLRHAGRRQGADFRLIYDRLFAVSPDGTKIAYNFEQGGEIGDVIFDLDLGRVSEKIGTETLRDIRSTWRGPEPPAGLTNWRVNENPAFNGKTIRLGLDERSVSADKLGDGFVIGGDRGIYVFGPDGSSRARIRLDVAAFGVLALDDNRFIGAMGDGTLRWFSVVEDRIVPQGSYFFARSGRRWLAWLPDGRFDHSENGGQELAGYHLNGSEKEAADWIEFSQLYRARYAPDVVRETLLGRAVADGEDAAFEPLQPPKVELTEFCPIIGGEVGPCAEAKLAKRGFAAIADDAATAPADGGSGVRARQLTAEAQAVILKFKVTGAPDGLSKIDVFQNQRTTGGKTRGLAAIADEVPEEEGVILIERRAPLRDGLNVLQVRVYDQDGVYGQSVELELFRPAAGQTAQPNLYVLAVGANDYGGGFSDLEFALTDAQSLADTVGAARPSAYGEVIIEPLLDKDVTRENIVAAIGRLAEKSNENDSIVVYFAGHGIQLEDGLYRYITADVASPDDILNRSLDQETLITALGQIKAQNLLLMLDTCYSGAFPAATAGTISNETGLMVLSASNTVEEALDGYDGQNGVFAYALLKGLIGGAAGPTGVVDAATVATYVRDLVPALAQEKSHSQRPQLFIARNSAPFPITQPGG